MSDRSTAEQAYKQFKRECKKLRKEFEKATENWDEHTSGSLPDIGHINKHTSYKSHGYFYINSKRGSRRKVYDKDGRGVQLGQALEKIGIEAAGGVPTGSPQHGKRYSFLYSRSVKGGEQWNFLSSKHLPYEHEAHHLVPDSSFHSDTFSDDQRVILRKLPYDLDHGENIMMLPKQLEDSDIHDLPQHSGNHPKYTDLVRSDMSELSGQIQKLTAKPCQPLEKPGISIADTLIDLEDDYWGRLVSWGAVNINEAAKRAPSGV